MKTLIFIATFLVLGIAGAYAQTAELQVMQIPLIEKKKLKLKYFGSDSSSLFERISKNDVTSRYSQKHKEAKVRTDRAQKLKSEMSIKQLDSSVKFHILATVSDSTILSISGS